MSLGTQAKALFQRLRGRSVIPAVTSEELNTGTKHMTVEKATISSVEKATIVHAVVGSDRIRTWDEIVADCASGGTKPADPKPKTSI